MKICPILDGNVPASGISVENTKILFKLILY